VSIPTSKRTNDVRWRTNRFQYFKWPLTLFEESIELRKDSFPLDAKTKKTKYPIRVLRYWWAISAINDELKRMESPPVIADIGCDRAIFKRLLPAIEGARIIGMDLEKNLNINKRDVELASYSEVLACDLDRGIPLPSSSIDIVVNLHVLEHLPRPEFAVREFERILRPGGLLLLGFPVLPKLFAQIREKQFANQFQKGTRVKGQHQHSFWPSRARRLVEEAGLEVEFILGSHFIRKRGAPWENFAIWVRINQIWGTLFPSLSQELCLKARKPL
jgi:SAM-dependent methyltransferase